MCFLTHVWLSPFTQCYHASRGCDGIDDEEWVKKGSLTPARLEELSFSLRTWLHQSDQGWQRHASAEDEVNYLQTRAEVENYVKWAHAARKSMEENPLTREHINAKKGWRHAMKTLLRSLLLTHHLRKASDLSVVLVGALELVCPTGLMDYFRDVMQDTNIPSKGTLSRAPLVVL